MISRYEAVQVILEHVAHEDLLLSTTGMISREVFSVNDREGNFYMIGSMGLLSAVGLGLALLEPDRRVIVLEGDGSALMSIARLPRTARERPSTLVHVILDNEAYESTGAQPSISSTVSLDAIARASGYASVARADERGALAGCMRACDGAAGPHQPLHEP